MGLCRLFQFCRRAARGKRHTSGGYGESLSPLALRVLGLHCQTYLAAMEACRSFPRLGLTSDCPMPEKKPFCSEPNPSPAALTSLPSAAEADSAATPPAADRPLIASGGAGSETLASANSARPRLQKFRKLSVLVPVHNERWTIETILRRALASPIPLEMEIVVVDDGSTDGSAEIAQRIAQEDSRVRLLRQPANLGKGAAVRRAIAEMSGDVAVVQDADLEYDPAEFPQLLRPILDGHADAVFGSRFAGPQRRVHLFWHSAGNKALTLLCNMLNDLNLTDMETCYKMVRADILRELRLTGNTFTFEPELTCRLAQWGARIFEVPVSYRGRRFVEGKKTGAIDGLKAVGELLRCRFVDTRFTHHTGMYVLRSLDRAERYNRWLIRQIAPYLGQRVVEAGSGIGNLSRLLLDREHLLLADHDPMYVAMLEDRFSGLGNVLALECDLTEPGFAEPWKESQPDTVFCSNVLEHLEPHREVLRSFHDALVPGGHSIIIVPAEPNLYTGLDESLGHYRRYRRDELSALMAEAGFEIVHTRQMCKVGSLAWLINGRLLRRRGLTPRQMLWFDRLWPIMHGLDRLLPWPGMSLIVVGRKSGG